MSESEEMVMMAELMRHMFMERKPYIMIEMTMYAHDGSRLSQTAAAVKTEDSNIAELLLMAFEASGKMALEVSGEVSIRVWHGDEDEAKEFAAKNQRLAEENAENPNVAVTMRNNLV
jgi:hypothetical protein